MLALGEVNSPKAAKALLDVTGKGPVRVEAMAGLVRLAGKGLLSDPEIEPLVIKKMRGFVKFHSPPKDDGIAWIRGQAADVLAELAPADSDGQTSKDLLVMLNDKDLLVPLRSKAARALGKLKYGDPPPAARPYLEAIVEFACDALRSDQPADRARVRFVARDVEDGMKPFAGSSLAADQALTGGVQKALEALKKDTAAPMTPDQLKAAIATAKESLDDAAKKYVKK